MIDETVKNEVRTFAREAGKLAAEKQKSVHITYKADGVDFATEIDQQIEQDFRTFISERFPDYGFFGEEFGKTEKDSDYCWTIDPIDGTKYYAASIPLWSVSIALMFKEEPIFSIIYFPAMDQLFEAERGNGAFVNGVRIEVHYEEDAHKLQLCWDAPFPSDTSMTTLAQVKHDYISYLDRYYRVRSIGSAALSLVWVATGFFGTYVKYCMSEKVRLDNYAGLLIAQEAGCSVTTYQNDGYERIVVSRCTNP